MISFKYFLIESSRGIDKWNKYFLNREVETTIKKTTNLFTVEKQKTNEKIPENTKIKVLNQEYDNFPIIEYEGKQYRVNLEYINKPIFKKINFLLKPDNFGIIGDIEFSKYKEFVIEKIKSNQKIEEDLKDYLISVVNLVSDEDSKEDVFEKYQNIKDDNILVNSLNNDFAEILGPIFAKKHLNLSNPTIFFPSKGNEELYDFKMIDNGQTYVFSSKTAKGKQTNLIKIRSILNKFKELPEDIKEKFSNEIKILEIIDSNSIKNAPVVLADYLGIKYDSKETIEDILKIENEVIKKINKDFNWLALINVTIDHLYFIKIYFDNSGIPILKSIQKGDEITKAFFRSKNSKSHFSDKIGIQI